MAIKNAVIEAMVEKWNLEASDPECEDDSESAKLGNAKNRGMREGIGKCAEQLKLLLNLIATDDRKDERVDVRV